MKHLHSAAAAFLSVAAVTAAHAEVDTAKWVESQRAAAITEMTDIAIEDPNDVSTLLRLATMLSEAGMHAEAERLLHEAALDNAELNVLIEGQYTLDGNPCSDCDRGSIGPDVIVGDLNGFGNYTRWNTGGPVNGIMAFSVGTTSCNLGDVNLQWFANNNRHPVIAQNFYRLKDGRYEQIGMSWLKHGFTALQQSLCATPQNPCQSSGSGSLLGVYCSDPYSASLNGSYSWLGPRWQVDAASGFFTYPYATAPNNAPIGKRLQVLNDDMDPALNPGALFFAEGLYVAPDDHEAGNARNNASYRRFTFTWAEQGGVGTVNNLSWAQATQRQQAGIQAWQDFEPGVTILDVDVPNDSGPYTGHFIVGYKVFDNGDGTWDYEYAIQNLTSHRSGQSFSVPVPANVNVTNVGAHYVNHHSGDGEGGVNYSSAPWNITVANGAVTWATETFSENINANALRWGTMYNFRFTADAKPEAADATLGLFRPGTPDAMVFTVDAPGGCELVGDINGDGAVDFADLSEVLTGFGGSYDFQDLSNVLSNFGQEC
ncbi:MAG: tetratricopeptide repeat protein [Phycisphaerales bacterium]|nr:MAG: tetratricopeptide repeat protein [Phycisphaerales bacterium]